MVYIIVWVAIMASSRFSMSALGLDFAPSGSVAIDTVAVMILLVPAVIVGRCLESRIPTLEETRSRRLAGQRLSWSVLVVCASTLVPTAMMKSLLHNSVDELSFLAGWAIVLGVWLALDALASASLAAATSFAMLAISSTPGLVPWQFNLFYNVDAKLGAWVAGLAFLTLGVLLQTLFPSSPLRRTSAERYADRGRP